MKKKNYRSSMVYSGFAEGCYIDLVPVGKTCLYEQVYVDKKTGKRVEDSGYLRLVVHMNNYLDVALRDAMDLLEKSDKDVLEFTFEGVTLHILKGSNYYEVLAIVERAVGEQVKSHCELNDMYYTIKNETDEPKI